MNQYKIITLCGSTKFKSSFEKVNLELTLIGKIILEDGVWIAAKSVVSSGVTCKTHSVLTLNSVATQDLDEYGIYRGNPAVKYRNRIVEM